MRERCPLYPPNGIRKPSENSSQNFHYESKFLIHPMSRKLFGNVRAIAASLHPTQSCQKRDTAPS